MEEGDSIGEEGDDVTTFSDRDLFSSDEDSIGEDIASEERRRSNAKEGKYRDEEIDVRIFDKDDMINKHLAQTRAGNEALRDILEKSKSREKTRAYQQVLRYKAQIKAMKLDHQDEIRKLKIQIARLQDKNTVIPKLRRRLSDQDVLVEELKKHLSNYVEETERAGERTQKLETYNRTLREKNRELEERLRISFFDSERLQIQIETNRQMKEYLAQQWEETEKKVKTMKKEKDIQSAEAEILRMKIQSNELLKRLIEKQLVIDAEDVGVKLLVKREMLKIMKNAEEAHFRHPLDRSRPF